MDLHFVLVHLFFAGQKTYHSDSFALWNIKPIKYKSAFIHIFQFVF